LILIKVLYGNAEKLLRFGRVYHFENAFPAFYKNR